jgi:hypothetical protein
MRTKKIERRESETKKLKKMKPMLKVHLFPLQIPIRRIGSEQLRAKEKEQKT